jgi:hypothetical protein
MDFNNRKWPSQIEMEWYPTVITAVVDTAMEEVVPIS